MNHHAHKVTLGKPVRPRRRPAKEIGDYEVSSFQPLEALGYLTTRVYAQVIEPGVRTLDGHLRGFSKQEVRQLEANLQQALANAWAQKF